jgi:hypothetical protein
VSVSDSNQIVLSGTVASQSDKDRAEQIAKTNAGSATVVNNIKVSGTTGSSSGSALPQSDQGASGSTSQQPSTSTTPGSSSTVPKNPNGSSSSSSGSTVPKL